MSYENHQGPTIVNYGVTSSLYEYLMRCMALGAIEGPIGSHDLAPPLKEILQAAHHWLAGGEVEVKVVRRGNPDIVNELDSQFDKVGKDANELNRAAGYYVAGAV
jgi:hypothetical protein